MTQRYRVRFRGPFSLAGDHDESIFAVPSSKQCGLYVWVVPYFAGGYIVTYVGETQYSFGRRMKSHMIQGIGGNYRISDPDLLVRGVDRVLWNGLWRRGTPDKMPEYLQRFVGLPPVIRKALAVMRVLVAPLESTRRARRRIEGALAHHIRGHPPPASALLPQDIRYCLRREDEAPLQVQFLAEIDVLGFPTALEA